MTVDHWGTWLVGLLVLAVILAVANAAVQRILPTRIGDGMGRTLAYRLLVRLTTGGLLALLIVLGLGLARLFGVDL